MTKPAEKQQSQAVLLALVATLLWSTVATAFKLALTDYSPAQLLWLATLVSLIIYGVIVVAKGELNQLASQFKQHASTYIVAGTLNPFLYYLVLFQAYDLLPAQTAQALNYTWSVVFVVLSALLLKQPLRKTEVLSLFVAYAGAFIIVTGGQATIEAMSTAGVALALFSTLLWSFFWIAKQHLTAPAHQSLFICFLIGFPLITLYLIFNGEGIKLASPALIPAIYVGVFEMGITFIIWLLAVNKAERPASIGLMIYLSPFLSLLLIYHFLGEPILPHTFVGLLVIVAAILLPKLLNKHRKTIED